MAGGGQGTAIGIDIGTSYFRVGLWDGNRINIISTTPSCVAFAGSKCLIGEEAKNQFDRNPTNTVFGFKRLIGRKFSEVEGVVRRLPFKVVPGEDDKPMIAVEYNGQEQLYSAEEITCMVLAKMKGIAEEHTGTKVEFAVITAPSFFNQVQRKAVHDAAVGAGLSVLRILNDSTAAAIAYAFDKKGKVVDDDDEEEVEEKGKAKNNVLVFDLGGGNIDCAVITIEDGRKLAKFTEKATAGDSGLGGEGIDDIVVDSFVDQVQDRYKKKIAGDRHAVGKLRNAWESAKRRLSTEITATTVGADLGMEVVLSRNGFSSLTQELIAACRGLVEKCVADAGLGRDAIDDVVLVGGSSRISGVEGLFRDCFGISELYKSSGPDDCGVAIGAAIYAANARDVAVGFGGKPITCYHVAPNSLGLETSGGVMTAVIERKARYPVEKVLVFAASSEGQERALIQVYEGEGRGTDLNNLLGNFVVEVPGNAPKGVVFQINVCFGIDASGLLSVSAKYESKEIMGQKRELIINSCEVSPAAKSEMAANMGLSWEYTEKKSKGWLRAMLDGKELEEDREMPASKRLAKERSAVAGQAMFGELLKGVRAIQANTPENRSKARTDYIDYLDNRKKAFLKDMSNNLFSGHQKDAVDYSIHLIGLEYSWARSLEGELPQLSEFEDRKERLELFFKKAHLECVKWKAKSALSEYLTSMYHFLIDTDRPPEFEVITRDGAEFVDEVGQWLISLDDFELPEAAEIEKRKEELEIILKPAIDTIRLYDRGSRR